MARVTMVFGLMGLMAVMAPRAGAQESLAGRMELSGVEIVVNEGDEAIQTVRAERARLSPAGDGIDAFDVVVEVRTPDSEEPIILTSPRGRVFHAVPERVDIPVEREPSSEQLLQLRREILQAGEAGPQPSLVRRSDFILFSDEDELVVANLGDRGEVTATTIYWGGYWQKFISLGPFEQISREDGETLRATGTGFYTEMSFNYWDYFTLDGVETRFDLVSGEETDQ